MRETPPATVQIRSLKVSTVRGVSQRTVIVGSASSAAATQPVCISPSAAASAPACAATRSAASSPRSSPAAPSAAAASIAVPPRGATRIRRSYVCGGRQRELAVEDAVVLDPRSSARRSTAAPRRRPGSRPPGRRPLHQDRVTVRPSPRERVGMTSGRDSCTPGSATSLTATGRSKVERRRDLEVVDPSDSDRDRGAAAHGHRTVARARSTRRAAGSRSRAGPGRSSRCRSTSAGPAAGGATSARRTGRRRAASRCPDRRRTPPRAATTGRCAGRHRRPTATRTRSDDRAPRRSGVVVHRSERVLVVAVDPPVRAIGLLHRQRGRAVALHGTECGLLSPIAIGQDRAARQPCRRRPWP